MKSKLEARKFIPPARGVDFRLYKVTIVKLLTEVYDHMKIKFQKWKF